MNLNTFLVENFVVFIKFKLYDNNFFSFTLILKLLFLPLLTLSQLSFSFFSYVIYPKSKYNILFLPLVFIVDDPLNVLLNDKGVDDIFFCILVYLSK